LSGLAPLSVRAHIDAAFAGAPTPRARDVRGASRVRNRVVIGAVCACAIAFVIGATGAPSAAGGATSDAGTAFLQKAAQANAAEIKTSQAAQTRAANPAVKAFADRMVDEHTANQHALGALAKKRNVAVSDDPDPDRLIRIGSLQKLKGVKFDHAYVKIMVEDHQSAVSLFENASRVVHDAEILQFVDATLPVLREHVQAAKALPR
jgi:putative membrane protein